MVRGRIVVFQTLFEKQGQKIARYIRIYSPKNSETFKNKVLIKINTIKQNPHLFPSEKYLYTKQGLYRFALIMKSWKIIYKVTNSKLTFLGIIHTAQHPREIKNLRTKLT